MSFSKSRFALFMSLPLAPLDWQNLAASSARLVQLPLAFCDQATLERMRGMGIRIVVRVGEDAYYDDLAPGRIRNAVLRAQLFCPIEAAIIGNESENAQNLAYGSSTWGQPFAYVHRQRFDAVRIVLQAAGIKVISPAFTCRMLTESDRPQPGEQAWKEIVTLPQEVNGQTSFGYHSADGCGFHLYTHNWLGPVDELRVLFMLQRAQTQWHKELWIDEVGINQGTQVERMAGYLSIAEMLLDTRLPYGARVSLLSPFVSNGIPNGQWSPGYLLTDPQVYRMLGDWVGH